MTTLIYKFADFPKCSGLMLTSLTEGEGDGVQVEFQGFDQGELRLGERSFKLRRGCVKLRKSSLPEGEIAVKLITDTRIFSLPPLEYSHGRLTSRECILSELTAARDIICRLAARTEECEKRITRLEELLGKAETFRL